MIDRILGGIEAEVFEGDYPSPPGLTLAMHMLHTMDVVSNNSVVFLEQPRQFFIWHV